MWADLRAAISFLTVIPLGYAEGRKPGWSFAWYPLVGVLIGTVLALIAAFSPLAPTVTAFIVLVGWVVLTGGLHLDGFGDSCDGLLATVDPARRLEIMKDPRTGSWAVIGLILLLLGKWTLIQTVSPVMLIVPPIIGRWVMIVAAYAFPYARQSGLGSYFRDGLGRAQLVFASVFTLIVVIGVMVVVRPAGLIALLVAVLLAFGVGRWAAKRLNGGLTGDVYGALCELTELLCLLGLSVWKSG